MKQKAFFISFKGLPMKKIKATSLEDQGPTLTIANPLTSS